MVRKLKEVGNVERRKGWSSKQLPPMEISGVMDYKVQNKSPKKFSKDLENR